MSARPQKFEHFHVLSAIWAPPPCMFRRGFWQKNVWAPPKIWRFPCLSAIWAPPPCSDHACSEGGLWQSPGGLWQWPGGVSDSGPGGLWQWPGGSLTVARGPFCRCAGNPNRNPQKYSTTTGGPWGLGVAWNRTLGPRGGVESDPGASGRFLLRCKSSYSSEWPCIYYILYAIYYIWYDIELYNII